MTIYFGENLKRLRKGKNLTQETLADFLGVSFQAVSKWERGETYPEITILPAISAFFGVSIDDLFGIDKTQQEQKINNYINLYDNMKLKDASLVFEEFSKAVKEFPGEFRILIRYMELLHEEKGSVLKPDCKKTSDELISIYENIQKHCTDDSIRIWSKRIIINHLMKKYDCTCNEEGRYRTHEEYLKQAKNIVSTLPAMADSKECMSLLIYEDSVKKAIEEMMYQLQNTIIGHCYYSNNFSHEHKISIISHMNALFEMLFTDGNYGKNTLHLLYNYGHLGHLYSETGNSEKAMEYLKKAAEFAVKCDTLPDISEKAAWFYEREPIFRDMNMCTRMELLMTEYYPLTDEFKATPEFKEILSVLNPAGTPPHPRIG